ncbi:UAA transporter [Ganoderma leucocontextum]|nr:UAA transporter [Ganoderma leucocontextum]
MSLLVAGQGVRGLTLAVISEWTSILTFIFGGCCSNALTLEQLMRAHPHSGSLITFAQFLSIAIHGLPKFVTVARVRGLPVPWLRKRKIPLAPYLVQVALFYAISLLNNRAFGYRIPMPVHIIFRSGGLVVSMVMGWLFAGKRYNLAQVASVLLVTAGVVLTTLSASKPRTKAQWPPSSSLSSAQSGPVSATGISPTAQYATGIAILSFALVLGGALGLVQDWTYNRYTRGPPRSANASASNDATNGNPKTIEGKGKAEAKTKGSEDKDKATKDDIQPWQESMFYLHFLGLPMFYFIRDDLLTQVASLNASTPLLLALPRSLPQSVVNLMPVLHPPLGLEQPMSLWPGWFHALGALPSGYVPLALTTLTSIACVAGVNRLTARVSSLTVTLVLVVRKAVSMVISVALFGAKSGSEVDAGMMWAGAAAVFLGTMAYALGSRGRGGKGKTKKD